MRPTQPAEEHTDGFGKVTTQDAGALVDVRGLTWRPFGRRSPALADVTLRIEPGERILLAGPSGSGKSTLLRALAGVLTTVDSGELTGTITIDGTDPREGAARSGLLIQDPADATVAGAAGRDVAFGPENMGMPRERIWSSVRHTLEAVGFPYGLDHPVNALSGGEAQRLALAGVLVLGPRLVLLDEPTSMLDPAAAVVVREAILAAVRRSGATMVLVEHHLEGWLDDVDRVVVMNHDGRIRISGAAAATLQDHADSLAGHGVWVPGAAAPTPLRVPGELCAPAVDGTRGRVVISARDAGVVRRPRVRLTSAHTRQSPSASAAAALSGIDATVRAGEILAVVGVSGAGKSTLTALLAGMELPTSGEVVAADDLRAGAEPHPGRWQSRDLAKRMGWVPQQAELAVIGRTVREDVLSTSRLLEIDEKAAARRTDRLLEVLGLSALSAANPHQLSGGELRRFALAGAVAHGPAVLVLDEPTVGQDRGTWAAVTGIILAARDAGVAVVVATHDRMLIELADRRLDLRDGRMVEPARDPGIAAPSAAEPGTSASGVGTGARPHPGRDRWRGLAARCGPLSLLGSAVLLLIAALFIRDIRTGLAGVGVELLLAPLILGWTRPAVRRLLPGLLAVVSVAFSTWLLSPDQNAMTGVTAGLRIAFFVLPGILLAGFIEPFTLGDHLAQRLRLPARPVVAAVAALQRFETLGEQWDQLRRTRRMRGLDGGRSPQARWRQLGALTFGLLVQSLRQAGRMAVAMEARGFSATHALGVPRTWAEPAPWRFADTVLLGVGLVVAAVPVVLSFLP